MVLIGVLTLAGCGFTPIYGTDGVDGRLKNAVALQTPDSVFGFRMRERLEASLGAAQMPQFKLDVTVDFETDRATITDDNDIARLDIIGKAKWALTTFAGEPVDDGRVQTFTSYSATGSTVATQNAEIDAEARLAVALADLIVQRLVIEARNW